MSDDRPTINVFSDWNIGNYILEVVLEFYFCPSNPHGALTLRPDAIGTFRLFSVQESMLSGH